MDPNLSSLVASYGDSHPDEYTHMLLYHPRKSFGVNARNIGDFWKEYCDMIYGKQSGDYCLGEFAGSSSPIIVVCNFQFRNGPSLDEIYDDNFLLLLVKSFQDSIRENLILSDVKHELTCCVLTSDEDYIDERTDILTCQIRLQFPYCRIERSVYYDIILPHAIQNLRNNNVFVAIQQQPLNDWDNIIQTFGPGEAIPLYMSKNQIGYPNLQLAHVYNQITNSMLRADIEPNETDLASFFWPQAHRHVNEGLLPDPYQHNPDVIFWLPLFLSVHYCQQLTLPLHGRHLQSGTTSSRIAMSGLSRISGLSHSPNSSQINNKQNVFTITDTLLDMLKPKRIDEDNFWLDVGRALYNIYDGSRDGLTKWIRFTERSDKRDIDDCDYYYDTFDLENNLTVKTVAWYARQDSPQEYNRWHKTWYMPLMADSLSTLHTDVARTFYRVFWLEFACGSIKDQEWFHFYNNRWNKVNRGSDIRTFMSKELVKCYEDYRMMVIQQKSTSQDEHYQEQCENVINKIGALIKKLKNVNYKASIQKELADIYHKKNREFVDKLNKSSFLTAVSNGIIEVTDKRAVFRQGKPEDYISRCTTTKYPTEYTWEHRRVKEVLHWYKQTFMDEAVCDFVKKLHASLLVAGNGDKIFPVCTGDFNNGKSMWKKLIDCVLGPLAANMPTSVLSGKKGNASGPSPEMAQLDGARSADLVEPDDSENFRNGLLKMFTGGDSFFARFCRQDGGKVETTFILFLYCNKVPTIPNCDKAVRGRLTIIPFLTTWVEASEAPFTEEEQWRARIFPLDKFFDKKIPYMAPAALWIWVQTYEKYAREGLKPPQEVINHTRRYWEENDVYTLFSNEQIEPVFVDVEQTALDTTCKLSLQEVYTEFVKWFKQTYPGVEIPGRDVVKRELSIRWKNKPGLDNTWSGIQMKSIGNVAQLPIMNRRTLPPGVQPANI